VHCFGETKCQGCPDQCKCQGCPDASQTECKWCPDVNNTLLWNKLNVLNVRGVLMWNSA
jgi:hypothetical protein